MMLKAVPADVLHHPRQPGNMNHGLSPEGVERIVGEPTVSDVGANASVAVVGTDAAKCDRAGWGAARKRADGILFSKDRSENGRGADPDIRQEVLCPVAAVEEDALFRVLAVVVIPIDEGTGPLRSKLQCIH